MRPVQPGHCLDMVAASSQYIDSGLTVTGGTAVDVSFTINPDTIFNGIIGCGGDVNTNKGFLLNHVAGNVSISSADGTTLFGSSFTSLTISAGTWYECRLVWDGATSTPTLTVNGVDYVTAGTISGWVGASGENLKFGEASGSFFDGKLGFCKYAGVFQYNNDFSSGTSAIDSSGNNNDGTLVNGPTWTTSDTLPYSWLNQVGYTDGIGSSIVSDFAGWIDAVGATKIVSDTAYDYVAVASAARSYRSGIYTSGRMFRVSFEVYDYVAGGVFANDAGGSSTPIAKANGFYTGDITTASTTIRLTASGVTTLKVRNFTLRELFGLIPRDESDPTKDTQGNTLQWSGSAFPRRPEYRGSYLSTWNGTTEYLAAAHLGGAETVISNIGTSTPSISAGRVDFTAGTCSALVLSDGTIYTLSEGVGSTVHDISGNGNDGTITNASTATEGAGFWAGRIDGEANAHNINNGFSLYESGANDLRVPYVSGSAHPSPTVPGGYTLTSQNPAVANSHNDAETTWDFENIGTGDTIAPETSHLSNFDAVTFSDTNYSLGITSPIDSVFWRDKSGVLKDRGIAFGATLTGAGLVYANNYTDGERWNNLAPWDDDNIWND